MQQSFSYNSSFGPNRPYSSGFFGFNIKTMITIFIVIEFLTAGILFGFYLYFFDTIAKNLGATQADGKAIASFLLAIVTYLLWKTCFAAYTTLKFIRNNDYNEISANRWLFVALSLSLGGMWTPFILTALPNASVQSTINPRHFLVRTYGIISAIGALIALAVYFLSLKVGINSLNDGDIFRANTTIGTLTIITLVLSLTLSSFGILSIWTWNKNKKNDFNVNEANLLFRAVSTIWLVIVSVEVTLTLVYAIVRFLGLLSQTLDFIRQSRGTRGMLGALWMFPILMMNITFQLLYVFWIGYIVHQTIQGLWKPQVTYRTFESLARFQEKRTKLSN